MSNPEIEDIVAKARLTTPRFLFRYWDATSGGHSQLNVSSRITASKFKPADDQPPLKDSDLPVPGPFTANALKEDFARHAMDHLCGVSDETYFSSWSHSLSYVLCLARARLKANPKLNKEHARIAILDTEKCPENPIYHTTFLNQHFDQDIPTNPWEYLIYGAIKGEAYQCVRWSQMEAHVNKIFAESNRKLRQEPTGVYDVVDQRMKEFMLLIHVPYRKVVMVHLVAIAFLNEKGLPEAAMALGDAGIPSEWAKDDKLLSPDDLDCHDVPEVLRANEILRMLVLLAGASGGDMTPSDRFTQRHEHAKQAIFDAIGYAEEKAKQKGRTERQATLVEYDSLMSMWDGFDGTLKPDLLPQSIVGGLAKGLQIDDAASTIRQDSSAAAPRPKPAQVIDLGSSSEDEGDSIVVKPRTGPLRVINRASDDEKE